MEKQFSEEMDKVLLEFVETYGIDAQLEQVIEECSELILAIQKYKRNISKCNTLEEESILKSKVIDEIADVSIMMRQCNYMFSKDDISMQIISKIERQKNRLESKKTKV